jgi:molybdate transport system substrate-binding protein
VSGRRPLRAWVVLAAALVACGARHRDADAVVVFAAASLTDAVTEIGAEAAAAGEPRMRTSFAASAALAAQIVAGAPADVFLSADPRWMDDLAARGMIASGTRIEPIANRLVVIAAPGASPPAGDPTAPGVLLRALGPDGRLAVGDPAYVPAGHYARAALALVARGETPLGIVYATDAAIAAAVRVVGELPADASPPIRYAFAIVAGHETPAVRTVFARLTGPAGLAVFERRGFRRS